MWQPTQPVVNSVGSSPSCSAHLLLSWALSGAARVPHRASWPPRSCRREGWPARRQQVRIGRHVAGRKNVCIRAGALERRCYIAHGRGGLSISQWPTSIQLCDFVTSCVLVGPVIDRRAPWPRCAHSFYLVRIEAACSIAVKEEPYKRHLFEPSQYHQQRALYPRTAKQRLRSLMNEWLACHTWKSLGLRFTRSS
jgi:hypothetical protein